MVLSPVDLDSEQPLSDENHSTSQINDLRYFPYNVPKVQEVCESFVVVFVT